MVERTIRHLTSVLALVAALTAAEGVVFADEGTAPAATSDSEQQDDSTRPTRRWYGWTTLTVDLLSLLSVLPTSAVARDAHAPELLVLSLAAYGLGTPLVHAVHGHRAAPSPAR